MRVRILVGLLTLGTYSWAQTFMKVDEAGMPHRLRNMLAPNFKATTLDGKEIILEDLKGKIVFLHFWSLSCSACFKELPDLNALVKQYSKRDIIFVSLMYDSKEAILRKFELTGNGYRIKKPIFNNQAIDFQIVPDAMEIMKQYTDQVGFPEGYILDKTGRVAFYITGYAEQRDIPGEITTKQMLTKAFDRLLSASR